MEAKDVAKLAYNLWDARGLKGNKDQMLKLLESSVQLAVDKVAAMSTEFTFAIDNDIIPFTTGDSNTVEVFGKNSNARAVYTVLWGSADGTTAVNRLLRKYSEYEKDFTFSNSIISGQPVGWVDRGTGASGFPSVEILGGAVVTGDSITVRFFRNDIVMSEWPPQFEYVIRDKILGDADRNTFGFLSTDSVRSMIDFYTTPRKGGEQSLPDSNIIHDNLRRAGDLNVG